MTEKLLQFIWQFQYFNRDSLCTEDGEALQIIHPGQLNTHQGPDFFNGRIKIDRTEWAGHIELHLRSSDWKRHNHHNDPRYGKVILHVVWQNDAKVTDENGEYIPVVALQSRVSNLLLEQYNQWMVTPKTIPCHAAFGRVPDLIWHNWLDRLLAERLLEKCGRVSLVAENTGQHWEEICWRMICRYFGGPVNAVSFQQIAESLPIQLLAKHKNVVTQLEALLLGQAGLLNRTQTDPYATMLYREYQFLQKKYGLRVVNLPPSFLRMRPINFPTVRLAQLAMLVHQSSHLLSKLVEATTLAEVRKLFDITANDFWHYHFKLEDGSAYQPKRLGGQMIDTIIINAVIPVLFSYGHHQMTNEVRNKALNWLEDMSPEQNTITKMYAQLGRKPNNAADSQAMVTLKKEYCDAKRCLECTVGNHLLKAGA